MEVAICLVATAVVVWLLRGAIAKVPWVFYLVAAALSLVFGTGLIAQMSYSANMALVPVMRRCELAFSLLAIVMFIGVLPHGSKIRAQLTPIRGSLAIVAALLAACHIVLYGKPYLAKLGLAFGGLNTATYVALALAIAIAALLILLTITSVRKVREAMKPSTWKGIQRMAYVFFPLIAVHALFMIGPAALAGGPSAGNAAVYLVVIVAYLLLKLLGNARNQDRPQAKQAGN